MRKPLLATTAGILAAGAILLAGGQAPQPATTDDQLQLLRSGLFRDQSTLPTDPGRSIEQILDEHSAALATIDARLASLDPVRLDAIARRLADVDRALDTPTLADVGRQLDAFRQSLDTIERSGIADFDRDMQQIESTLDDISRALRDLPRASARIDQTGLDRIVRDIRSDTERIVSTLQSDLRSMQSTLRDLESRVRTLEGGRP